MHIRYLLLIYLLFLLNACSTTYTTPAGGVDLNAISDTSISELMSRKPQADFPAHLAVIRVQASGYHSLTNDSYGKGSYSVVTARDIESDSAFANMKNWSGIVSVAPIGRLLLPEELQTMHDLRRAAAKLKADMVLVYTVDSRFHVGGSPLGPLSLISLGLIPNQRAHVSSTVSGMLVDVRSGFIYGTAEATRKKEQRASIWNTESVIDTARLATEKSGFENFMKQAESLWFDVMGKYAD